MREDVEERHCAHRRVPDPAHQLHGETVGVLLVPARYLRGHVGPVLVIVMTKLVAEHEHDGGAEDLLKLARHARVRDRIVRDAKHVARPVAPARKTAGPLVLEHGQVVGDGFDAVARRVEPGIGERDISEEAQRRYRKDDGLLRAGRRGVEVHGVLSILQWKGEVDTAEAAPLIWRQLGPEDLAEVLLDARRHFAVPEHQRLSIVEPVPALRRGFRRQEQQHQQQQGFKAAHGATPSSGGIS